MESKPAKESNAIVPTKNIQGMIFTFRGVQVMIDRDLAQACQVENKCLNEPVRKNINRFPKEFRFQLHGTEKEQVDAWGEADNDTHNKIIKKIKITN